MAWHTKVLKLASNILTLPLPLSLSVSLTLSLSLSPHLSLSLTHTHFLGTARISKFVSLPISFLFLFSFPLHLMRLNSSLKILLGSLGWKPHEGEAAPVVPMPGPQHRGGLRYICHNRLSRCSQRLSHTVLHVPTELSIHFRHHKFHFMS